MNGVRTRSTQSWLHLAAGALCVGMLGDAMPAGAQGTNYDGTYAGTQTLLESGGNYSKCLKGPFKRKLSIKDGGVSYLYNPTYRGEATGADDADGGVTASTAEGAGVKLTGRIQGDVLTGEVWSIFCTYSLNLKRIP